MKNKIYIILTIVCLPVFLMGCRYYGYISPTRDANTVITEKRLKEKQELALKQEKIKNEEEIARREAEQTKPKEEVEDLQYYFE